ncbi:MAG: S8 family serine peptidase [Sphingomicrobium sp.]
MSRFAPRLMILASAAALLATAAGAQLLPSVGLPTGGLPTGNLPVGAVPGVGPVLQNVLSPAETRQIVNPTLDSVAGLPDSVIQSGTASLLDLRRLRLQQLIRENRNQLESDNAGQPVRRGVLVAINPLPSALQRAARAGFRTIGAEANSNLGFTTVMLAVPAGMSAREGLKRLYQAAPEIEADYDHIFEPAGGDLLPVAGALAAAAGAGGGVRIGIVDGGVASHPALAGASIDQHGFSGSPQATGHGTAVASLIVGNQGPFRGAARGASLFVADVYGGNRAAGSASAVVRALGWLASKQPSVINISLVGPPNVLLQRAVQQLRARGIQLVAAVGNDGPAAPPQYPASYPGVVAVTGVDGNGRALIEAGKADHLDFAAPGADMAAALPGQGYAKVRGTSFAAPLAAARLAAAGSLQRLALEARPGKGRVGRGVVCWDCRVDPKAVRAK